MRSDAYIRVTCDRCNCEMELPLTALAKGGWDERHVSFQLRDANWLEREGKDICDDCSGLDIRPDDKS